RAVVGGPVHLTLALFCKLQRKPYVLTQHIGVVPFKNAVLRRVLETVNRVLGKVVLNRAARVVFVSDEVRRYFATLGVEPSLTIPNGVDTSLYSPVAEKERLTLKEKLAREQGLDPSRPIVLFVGRFVEKKGVVLLTEISRQLPEVQWVFAGQGPLDPSEKIGPNARVLYGCRGAALAQWYRAADLFVLPSQGEGFPLVVQEALACGTPVLVESSLAKALPEVGPWLNVEAAFLASAPAAERQERANFAAKQWNWQNSARQYLDLFAQALENKKADPQL
ncbi:glycosyltransferase, partial [bacterium]